MSYMPWTITLSCLELLRMNKLANLFDFLLDFKKELALLADLRLSRRKINLIKVKEKEKKMK